MKKTIRVLSRAISPVLVSAVAAGVVVAQQTRPSNEAVAVLSGNWAGRIGDEVRGQDVLWRFERTSSGEIEGFMGPAATGSATFPMQNITFDGSALSFTVDSQNGRFAGKIAKGQATGSWMGGKWRPVNLTRSALDRPDGATAAAGPTARLIGRWEIRQGDTREGPPATYLRFALGASGELLGFTGAMPETITTPLAEVSLKGSILTFRVASPGPAVRRFTGEISGSAGTGTVFEGAELPITMDKTSR
jgi:hypothetical protein